MNAKEARQLTDETIAKNQIDADVSKIIEEIKSAIKREEYHVKLLRSSRDVHHKEIHITDKQISKLKQLEYNIEYETEHDYEVLEFIIVKW